VFGTYHGASTIMHRAFDWKRSRISMLDVLINESVFSLIQFGALQRI
jgi:hypothetical protein